MAFEENRASMERLSVMPPQGRRAWNELKDALTRNDVRAAVARYVGEHEVLKHLNYKSAKDVKAALNRAASLVKNEVGSARYALVVESNQGVNDVKSTHWLAEVLARKLGRWPDAVVTVDSMVAVMRRGIRTFVYFDDGMYSGSQVRYVIRTFQADASSLRADQITPRTRPRLLVALGFVSGAGMGMLKEGGFLRGSNKHEVRLLAGGRFHNVPNSLREDYLENSHALSVLAHKLPNLVSIPPWLYHSLRGLFPFEPYKVLYNTRNPPPTGYSKAYWARAPDGARIRYFVKGPLHEAFANVGGRLERRANLNKNVTRLKADKLKKKPRATTTTSKPSMPAKRRRSSTVDRRLTRRLRLL
jgi:hypothetical protein